MRGFIYTVLAQADDGSSLTHPLPAHVELLNEVSTRATGERVKEAIIKRLEEEEFKKRVEAVTEVLSRISTNEKDRRKIKPTYAGWGVDQTTGAQKPVGEPIYTKEQSESLKKLIEDYNKLTKAIELAIYENKFDKVYELTAKGKSE